MMRPADHDARAVHRAALLALATHAVAGAGLVLVLRPGLASHAVGARAAFVAGHVALWRLGWLAWSAAAVAILLLSVALSHRLALEGGAALRLAPYVTAGAVAVDLGGQMVAMALVPDAACAVDLVRFHALERDVALLSGALGNGLYTLAVVLLAWGARRRLPPWMGCAAFAVTVSGTVLTLGAVADQAAVVAASTAVLLPALLAWLWGVARATRIPA